MSEGEVHPRHQLVEVLQHPVRFSIMAALSRTDALGFRELRDLLEVTDSMLSKQVAALETAGYLHVVKMSVGRMPRTYMSVTRAGRAAWRAHIAALRQIAAI